MWKFFLASCFLMILTIIAVESSDSTATNQDFADMIEKYNKVLKNLDCANKCIKEKEYKENKILEFSYVQGSWGMCSNLLKQGTNTIVVCKSGGIEGIVEDFDKC